jgi:hypothetical protein
VSKGQNTNKKSMDKQIEIIKQEKQEKLKKISTIIPIYYDVPVLDVVAPVDNAADVEPAGAGDALVPLPVDNIANIAIKIVNAIYDGNKAIDEVYTRANYIVKVYKIHNLVMNDDVRDKIKMAKSIVTMLDNIIRNKILSYF